MDLQPNLNNGHLTLDDAAEVCALVVKHGCQAVGVFGGIARDGRGDEINLAIFTHPSVAKDFEGRGLELANETKIEQASIRRDLVDEMIGLDLLVGIPSLYHDIDPLLLSSHFLQDVPELTKLDTGLGKPDLIRAVTRDLRMYDPSFNGFRPTSG